MSLAFTDKQVRAEIAAKIATASGSLRVYPWNCLNFKVDPQSGKADFSDWIGLFNYAVANVSYIHGWVVRRIARESELLNGCENFSWFYEIYGFYEFVSGNASSNSDDTFSAILETVVASFNSGDQNGLLTVGGTTVNHYGLQFPVITIVQAGEKLLHFAGGKLEIEYST